MRSLSISWPVVLRKLLIAGTALCAAGAVVVIAGCSAAQRPTGRMVEHWGGTRHRYQHLTPVALRLPAPVAEVGSSNSTQYALLTNGSVYAWGLGTDGELGNGGTANSFNTPVRVRFPAGVTIASIPADVMPYNSAYAIDTSGHVWAWGANKGGEFCLGNTDEYTTPVRLPFAGVSTLAGAGDHATYDVGGTLYSCGVNEYGALGDGNMRSSLTRVKVVGLRGQPVASLVASWCDTGAVLSDGEYFDWGYDGSGQLGDGFMRRSSDMPVRVRLPHRVVQAAEGGSLPSNGQTLVLLSDGSLYAWGNDSFYQLGDGKTASEDRPEQIHPPAGVIYRSVATGGATSYAISTAGNVYAWGSNTIGQIGDGSFATAEWPVKIESGPPGRAKRPIRVASGTTISSTATAVVVNMG
jgi:alpha-tubulin suppressor-like RCC1 family protein